MSEHRSTKELRLSKILQRRSIHDTQEENKRTQKAMLRIQQEEEDSHVQAYSSAR